MKYFAVKHTLRIGGKLYVPCVSYEITRSLELTVNKLVEEDKAFVSEEYMVFESGRLVKKAEKKAEEKPKASKAPKEVKEDF